MLSRRRVERTPRGDFALRIPRGERALLRNVVARLELLLEEPDQEELRRLFPPAYEDADQDAEYRSLVRGDLLDGRREALRIVRDTVARNRLTAEEADAWLRVLNDARLVMGTHLDIDAETDFGEMSPKDPRDRALTFYAYLSWLQEQFVEAISAGIDAHGA